MEIKWVKRGNAKTLEDAITARSGMSAQELKTPADSYPEDIENMVEAAIRIKEAIDNKEIINVFGDYDADGVCSVAILYLMFDYFGVHPVTRLPKRMSEGYGLSVDAVNAMADDGLLITVDNGISAHEAIQRAKGKNMTVIVLDHHLPSETLPCADYIVNPHVHPEQNGFEDFCGGGLAYKLAQALIPESEIELLRKLAAIAAIATVGDVMPLTGANRVIVRDGLNAMNERFVTSGLKSLMDVCGFTVVDEDSLAFKLVPVLNAAGRLHDDGARLSSGCLAQDKKDMTALAERLVKINEERKALVNSTYQSIAEQVGEYPEAPIVVYSPDVPGGIAGIIAGRIAESYHMPAFVFAGDGPEIHGSGRNGGTVHLQELVSKAADLLVTFGGHEGAVGITILADNLDAFRKRLHEEIGQMEFSAQDKLVYDVEITPEEVIKTICNMKAYAPFGAHNPKPVFLLKNVSLIPRYGMHMKYMGKNGEHVKLNAKGYSLVGFGLSERYREIGEPAQVDVIGCLGMNESVYGSFPQVEIIDMRPAGQN